MFSMRKITTMSGEADQESGESTPTASSGIYEAIRIDILSGKLTANERLKISSLAKRYHTSTNPVREALQQLRGEGFVVITPNQGAKVREINEDFVRDLYEVEILLEPYLTRWFVGNCTERDLNELEEIADEIERLNFSDPVRHNELDTRFHRIMYAQHYNRLAVDLWWKHREILRVISVDHGTSLKRQRDVIQEHRELIAALRAHDEDKAAEIIKHHVSGSGVHIAGRMRLNRSVHS